MATDPTALPSFLSPLDAANEPAERHVRDLRRRVIRLLNACRIIITVGLLLTFYMFGDAGIVGVHAPELLVGATLIYLGLSLTALATSLSMRVSPATQLRATLLVDIILVAAIMHSSGEIRTALGFFPVVTLGASALVMPPRSALFFGALGGLAVLGEQTLSYLEGLTTLADFAPAGVAGAFIMVIVLIAQPVAQRLRESEALAEQRGVDLANLSELNHYIIQHLRESIVVLDADDRIRLINGAAARHLGLVEQQHGQRLAEVYPELHDIVRSWREDAEEARSSLSSFLAADRATVITPNFAPIGDRRPAPTLIFLEDSSRLAERVQQTKLAALGRLSASIAHEIRNPVGAISHASQLLGEADSIAEEDRRLTRIIQDHCVRVSRIIDNVLQLSRRDHARPQQLALRGWLREFLQEFAAGVNAAQDGIELQVEEEDLYVRMDPSHLNQVMWNLCENALRYAAVENQPIVIRASRLHGSRRPYLEVLDSGPGIDEEFREHVFEPFFTRARDGTGLGLFISRELCEVNGANLQYEPRTGGGSCFRVIFADPERWVV